MNDNGKKTPLAPEDLADVITAVVILAKFVMRDVPQADRAKFANYMRQEMDFED